MADYDDQDSGDEEIIVLTDEEGAEHEYRIAHVMRVDGKDYAILLPLHETEESDEAVILRIDQENDDDILVEIEDEEEFELVADAFEELLEDDEAEEDTPL